MSTSGGGATPVSGLDETLLASSQIRLFGRDFVGLTLNLEALAALQGGDPSPRKNPLTDKLQKGLDPRLARIYGFSFDGNYFKLVKPYVYLVHGDGIEIKERSDIANVGVEIKDAEFLIGVKMWHYDKVDFSVRIDIVSGWLEEILLDACLGSASNITATDVTGRADLAARADLSARADLNARADLSARADLTMRGRMR